MSNKNLQDLIKYIDFYGVRVGINFKNKQIHKTECGSIVSLIVIFIFLFSCYSYVEELAIKQKPIVITKERFANNPERMDIDNQHQTLVMGIRDSQGNFINQPSLIQVTGRLVVTQKQLNPNTQKYDITTKTTNLRIKQCTNNDIQVDGFKNYFNQFELDYLFCLDGNQEVFIQGDISQNIFSRVEVYFKKCTDQIGQPACAQQGQIDAVLENSYFNVYLLDKIIDPTDYENPFKHNSININTSTSSKYSKSLTAYFSNYYIQSDVGLAQENLENLRDFIYDGKEEIINNDDSSIITKFILSPSRNKETILLRRYMKIGDFLAQLGAILKTLIFLGFIITYPFTKFHLKKEIVNSIYEFDFEKYSNIIETKEIEQEVPPVQRQVKRPTLVKQTSNDQMQDFLHPNSGQCQKNNNFTQKFNNQLNERMRKVSFQINNGEQQKEKSDYYTICNTNQDYESHTAQGKQEFINKFSDKNQDNSKQSDQRKMSNSQSVKDSSFVPSRRFSQYAQQDQSSGNNVTQKDNKNIISDIQQAFRLEQAIKNWAREFIKPFRKVLTFNLIDYISHIFYPLSNEMKHKKDIVNESINYLNQRLDIEYIMHKFQELDKLKQVVLSDDQIKLFDLLPKPIISSNLSKSKKANLYQYCSERSYEEKLTIAQISLYNLLNKDRKSQRDLKILELLDTRIFEIFQNSNPTDQNKYTPAKLYQQKNTIRQRVGSCQNTIFNQITEQEDQYNNQFKIAINSPNKPLISTNAQLEFKQENKKLSSNDDSGVYEEHDNDYQRNYSLYMKYHKNSQNS